MKTTGLILMMVGAIIAWWGLMLQPQARAKSEIKAQPYEVLGMDVDCDGDTDWVFVPLTSRGWAFWLEQTHGEYELHPGLPVGGVNGDDAAPPVLVG